jgi:hypothetical protein
MVVVALTLNDVLLKFLLSLSLLGIVLPLNFVLCVEVVSSVAAATFSFDMTANSRSVVVTDARCNRFCTVVCDVIDTPSVGAGLGDSLSAVDSIVLPPLVLSKASVGLIFASVCALVRSLASGKSIFNELFRFCSALHL